MLREVLTAIAVLATAACGGPETAPAAEAGDAKGWTLSAAVDEGEAAYLVIRPDGMQAAARSVDGRSALMEAGEAHARVSEASAAPGPKGGQVSLSFPGFKLSVDGEEDRGGGAERARIDISVGGRTVQVDATEGAAAGAEQAVVTIRGATAEDARDFIADADGLSADVKAELRRRLGL